MGLSLWPRGVKKYSTVGGEVCMTVRVSTPRFSSSLSRVVKTLAEIPLKSLFKSPKRRGSARRYQRICGVQAPASSLRLVSSGHPSGSRSRFVGSMTDHSNLLNKIDFFSSGFWASKNSKFITQNWILMVTSRYLLSFSNHVRIYNAGLIGFNPSPKKKVESRRSSAGDGPWVALEGVALKKSRKESKK